MTAKDQPDSSRHSTRRRVGVRRVALAVLAAAAVAVAALLHPALELSAPAEALKVPAAVVPTGLPSGLRQAALDPATGTLWVLTRADADNSVSLTPITDNGPGETVSLSPEGTDWAAGSLTFHEGQVWAGWGAHLVSFDPASGAVRRVAVPWTDGPDGQTGRLTALGAAGTCIWVAVIGETQVRCYDTSTDEWRGVRTPARAPVSPFTRIASAGETVAVNLAPEAPQPAATASTDAVAWVPANAVPVAASNGAIAVVGTDEVQVFGAGGPRLTTLSDLGQPAVTVPTAFDGTLLTRVVESDGSLVLDRTDITTAAAGSRTAIPLPQVSVTPHYAPPGAEPRPGWAAAKVSAVAAAPDGGAWVVTQYGGGDAPTGWGAVVRAAALAVKVR